MTRVSASVLVMDMQAPDLSTQSRAQISVTAIRP